MNEATVATEGEVGFVTQAKGYLLTLEGLPSARLNTVIVNAQGERALVTAFSERALEAYLLDLGNPRAGDQFFIASKGIQFAPNKELFGRAINVLGEPIDGLGPFSAGTLPLRMEADAPAMSARAPLTEPLETGMPAIDILTPLAKGQRQMIIGPISSGKRVFVESVLSRHQGTGMICIYAFVGRPRPYIEDAVGNLLSGGKNKDAIILISFSDDPAPKVYLTPIVALELAESFSWEGKDVLVIIDDLGSHAKYAREIMLLSGKVPGRESYPGDMFFQQARLLERGGRFNKSVGGGSITLLPMLETNIEDLTNLVSTNLISATDGHLFFSSEAHAEGRFPAVIPIQSVTRVGRNTQNNLAKQLSINVHSLIAQYERQRGYSQFGTQLSEQTRKTIAHGEAMQVMLDQDPSTSLSVEMQLVLLGLVFTTLFDGRSTAMVKKCRDVFVKSLPTDSELEPILGSAKRGTISFDQFIRKLQSAVPHLATLCPVS